MQWDFQAGVYEISRAMVEDNKWYSSVMQSLSFLPSIFFFCCMAHQLNILQSTFHYLSFSFWQWRRCCEVATKNKLVQGLVVFQTEMKWPYKLLMHDFFCLILSLHQSEIWSRISNDDRDLNDNEEFLEKLSDIRAIAEISVTKIKVINRLVWTSMLLTWVRSRIVQMIQNRHEQIKNLARFQYIVHEFLVDFTHSPEQYQQFLMHLHLFRGSR